MFCRKCGVEVANEAQYCQSCGENQLQQTAQAVTGNQAKQEVGAEIAPSEERALFVGKNFDKYKSKFDKFDAKDGFAATWHWPCFFFGWMWFAYRKMYLWLVIDIVLSLLLSLTVVGGIIWMVVRGLLGNYLYWSFLKKKVPESRFNYQTISGGTIDPSGYRAYLLATGGPGGGMVVVVGVFVMVAVIGMLAAIAIPNFLKYQAKSKQSEAKVNLKGLFTSEQAYFGEMGFYSDDFASLGWTPSGEHRVYSYYLSPISVIPGSNGQSELPGDVEAMVANDSFKVVAVGNIDSDSTLDVWTIDGNNQLENVINDIVN